MLILVALVGPSVIDDDGIVDVGRLEREGLGFGGLLIIFVSPSLYITRSSSSSSLVQFRSSDVSPYNLHMYDRKEI